MEDEKQRRNDEDRLVDLALEWNYFDGVLPILQARQNEIVKKKYHFIEVWIRKNKKTFARWIFQDDIKRQKELFRKSLEKNRSTFIEYFLSAGFDPLTLAEKDHIHSYQKIILDLYSESHEAMNKVCSD